MSIFASIKSAIFGTKAAAATPASQAQTTPPAAAATAAPAPAAVAAAPAAAAPATVAAAPAAPKAEPVDVAAVMDRAVAAQSEKLAWRTSIVDTMKALKLDSSLASRKELAKELHYDGDMNDSAKMNVWLHKQVMAKLAENGGKVPAELHA